jgi:rhodanese-related sulfurtransferase
VTTTIHELLVRSRNNLSRLEPSEAHAAQQAGALIVDIRPELNRKLEGEIPGSIVIERNVLEWRLDPRSDARIPATSDECFVVVVCNEGYTSSLAAATLQELGVHRATDIIGGFRAWRSVGLPVVDGRTAAGDFVAG